ncbi:MAG: hypothetical protein JXK08_04510 [Flavobacteriaceae bacterium]|nr:hypothetical protein [Flavobacteriaceae bacterium]
MFLFFLLFMTAKALSQRITNTDIEAKIDTSSLNGIYQIKSLAYNKTELYKTLKYDFSVIKKNKKTNNSNKNKQEGLFTLEPNQTKELSQTSINLSEDDEVVIFLLIYEEENLVGKKVINLSASDNVKSKFKPKGESLTIDVDDEGDDGVEIRGLVTDETRTKFGREFYEAFANRYREDGVNAAKVIVVEEKFSLGRRTIIEVKIDNNLVYQFLIKPDVESIRQHSESCLRYIKRYLEREKENAKRIKEY